MYCISLRYTWYKCFNTLPILARVNSENDKFSIQLNPQKFHLFHSKLTTISSLSHTI